MAYEKHTWSCGDTVTADLLNHMEDGIENAGGGGTAVHVIDLLDTGEGQYEFEDSTEDVRNILQTDPWNCYVRYSGISVRLSGFSDLTNKYWFDSSRIVNQEGFRPNMEMVTLEDTGSDIEIKVVSLPLETYSN